MKKTPGSAPEALSDHGPLPGYGLVRTMLRELIATADRVAPSPFGTQISLRNAAIRVFLDTAEAGADVEPSRRARFYRSAWEATHDCGAALNAIEELEALEHELFFGARALLREAQQAVTIATGAMARLGR